MSRERYQRDWPEACEKPALLLFLIEDRREIARSNFYRIVIIRLV
jgi:hypothetical protein